MVSCEVKQCFTSCSYYYLKIQTTDPNCSTCSPYWNVLGEQILYFLKFFYYLLSHFENRWSNDFTAWLSHHWINDVQSGLINSKKISKNIKFGLQVHFNIEITFNGLDRLFGLRKSKNNLVAPEIRNNRLYISQPLSLSLSIYIE